MRFLFGRIFPMPFILAGAVVLFFGARSLQRANNSMNWPSASGTVVSSGMDRNRGENGTTYSAEVLYDYKIEGVTYSSNRVGYGDFGSSNPSGARKIINKYPKGLEIEVFYMPDNPEESVLETGIQNRTYFLPAFGSVFLMTGMAMFIFLPKLLSKQAEQQSASRSAVDFK